MNLASGLSYDTFRQYPVADRIDWIDALSISQIKAQFDSRSIKRFFSQLFEQEQNDYLRQRAVEYISELTLVDVIRYDYTKDFLLEEAKPTGNSFIDITRLKYLFLLYGDDTECYQVFEQESHKQDTEIASEACYRAGLVHLLYRVNLTASSDPVAEIHQAKEWFDLAQKHSENRIDAQFFSQTSSYLLSLLSLQPSSAEDQYDKLGQLLWERQLWGHLPNIDLLEYRVFNSLSKLRAMVHRTAQEYTWTDYKKEFLFLSTCFNELLIRDNISHRLYGPSSALAANSIDTILTRYYVHNLTACQVKINAILSGTDSADKSLTEFLTNLSVRLETYREKKKDDSLSTVAILCSGFSWIDPAQIVQDVNQLANEGLAEVLIQAQLAIRYVAQQGENRATTLTGYLIVDEIIRSVLNRLNQLIPSYPPKERAIFTTVLTDLIRYAYHAETQPKRFFPYLYDSTITLESVFQDGLFVRLTAGEHAANYQYEVSDIIGGSRVDIVYEDQQVVFPIEVKKTDKFLDWDSVSQNYVAQVQMYIRPYHKLGFLIIYDISSKQQTSPLNDIRSLVQILHLSPLYPIKEKHPDYVIAIIIPANKISPSGYTTYR
ncbi:hypothetical protein [Fibrella arboris]|uniref:hypothetical protein n=1 Tax=Fibrella arboris TaxID=3242486 RepID=UPI003522E238